MIEVKPIWGARSAPGDGTSAVATHVAVHRPVNMHAIKEDPPRFRRPLLSDEHRTREQIVEHYLVEKSLASRLRSESSEHRSLLYRSVYDELFRRLPHHPQHLRKATADEDRVELERQLGFLLPHLDGTTTFAEIGAGDCALSLAVAHRCRQVFAIDVSEVIAQRNDWPANCTFLLTEGTRLPMPDATLDVAYSNQLMEHLHPEDALSQLRDIHRVLRPGGRYVCITPNSVAGPWDISVYFDDVATGLHLREYRVGELVRHLRDAGFSRIDINAGGRGFFLQFPQSLVELTETVLLAMPYGIRSRIARWLPVRGLLGLRVVAWK